MCPAVLLTSYQLCLALFTGSMIHKVLHPENDLTLRCYGIKLLVLFMLATQDNGDDACLELFSTAVPGFPPPLVPVEGESVDDSISEQSSSVVQRYGSYLPNENTTWWDSTPGIGWACLSVYLWFMLLFPHNNCTDIPLVVLSECTPQRR